MKRRFGTALALQGAAACFLAGTLACGLAPDIWLLLAGRVFQGMGEGAISGLTYMLIPEVFPAALIPAVFGIEAVIWASGSTGGPILGGFLTQALNWRAAFLVEVPMVLAFMLLVRFNIPGRATARTVQSLGLGRLLGVGLGILLLSLAAIEPRIWMRAASTIAALGLLALLVRRDQKAPNRLRPVPSPGAHRSASPSGWCC
jgi:MFS family permease